MQPFFYYLHIPWNIHTILLILLVLLLYELLLNWTDIIFTRVLQSYSTNTGGNGIGFLVSMKWPEGTWVKLKGILLQQNAMCLPRISRFNIIKQTIWLKYDGKHFTKLRWHISARFRQGCMDPFKLKTYVPEAGIKGRYNNHIPQILGCNW